MKLCRYGVKGAEKPALVDGDGALRDLSGVIADLTELANVVLSTGGGAVLRPNNRVRLRDNGTVIYLHAEPVTLWARLRHSRNRPLLQTSDPLARLAELYRQRDAFYRETATYIVESDRTEVMRLVRTFDPAEIAEDHDSEA